MITPTNLQTNIYLLSLQTNVSHFDVFFEFFIGATFCNLLIQQPPIRTWLPYRSLLAINDISLLSFLGDFNGKTEMKMVFESLAITLIV